jgi:hypothetical protein
MQSDVEHVPNWDYQHGHVEGYLSAMGYNIVTNRSCNTSVDFSDKIVYLNTRFSPEIQFYLLLHELGHVLIWEEGWYDFESEHPLYIRYAGKCSQKSYAGRVSVLGEEYEAWRLGRRWARHNSLCIDDKKYDKTMTKNLMTYITWAADPSNFEDVY